MISLHTAAAPSPTFCTTGAVSSLTFHADAGAASSPTFYTGAASSPTLHNTCYCVFLQVAVDEGTTASGKGSLRGGKPCTACKTPGAHEKLHWLTITDDELTQLRDIFTSKHDSAVQGCCVVCTHCRVSGKRSFRFKLNVVLGRASHLHRRVAK